MLADLIGPVSAALLIVGAVVASTAILYIGGGEGQRARPFGSASSAACGRC